MKTIFTSLLTFGSLLTLPFAAHAVPETPPYVVTNQSTGYFYNNTGHNLANGLPLYQSMSLLLGFEAFRPITHSGFDSLANQDSGDLFFSGNRLSLYGYEEATEDDRGYAFYVAEPDTEDFTAGFFRWVNSADVMIVGEIVWYRIGVENIYDTTPVISALFKFTTQTGSSDPLAQLFFNELMALTNDTGYLLLESGPTSSNVLTINNTIPNGMNVGDSIAAFSGTLTAMPEPATLVAVFAAAALACAAVYRRHK